MSPSFLVGRRAQEITAYLQLPGQPGGPGDLLWCSSWAHLHPEGTEGLLWLQLFPMRMGNMLWLLCTLHVPAWFLHANFLYPNP